MSSSVATPALVTRVAHVLGASAFALTPAMVRALLGDHSLLMVRMALRQLKEDGVALFNGTKRSPWYLLTDFGRQQYPKEVEPPSVIVKDARGGWTDWRVDELRRLRALRYSFGYIAKAIGGGLSRNACIGKAARMGLDTTRAVSTGGACLRKRRSTVARRVESFSISAIGLRPSIDVYAEPMSELPAEAIPLEQRKQLLDLEHGDCRFPYGDPVKPGFFFCGGVSEPNQPYCSYHCRIAFNGTGRTPQTPEANLKRRLAAIKRKSHPFDRAHKPSFGSI